MAGISLKILKKRRVSKVSSYNLFIYIAQGINQPINLKCHVCNGTRDSECNDPFGAMSENGVLIPPDRFEYLCNDEQYRYEHGVPHDKMSTMCRKMTQYGIKPILNIFINQNIEHLRLIC